MPPKVAVKTTADKKSTKDNDEPIDPTEEKIVLNKLTTTKECKEFGFEELDGMAAEEEVNYHELLLQIVLDKVCCV